MQFKHILGALLLLLISVKGFTQPVAPAFSSSSLAPFTIPNLTSFVIDYNNDGVDDVVGYRFQYANTGKLWKNNGNGTFSDVSSTVAFSNYNWTGALDFDRNGLMDVYQLNGDTLRISFNTSDGFTTPDLSCGYYLLSNLFGTTANNILNPILGDFNGDGVYDIISQIISGASTKINAIKGQLGCVNGCFFRFPSQTPSTLISLANTTNTLVKLADIDNDFDMDLLVGRGTTYQNYAYSIYKKSATGYALFSGSGYDIGRQFGFGTLGDFNNDGRTDIVSGAEDCCVTQGDVLYVYYSNPNGTYAANSSVMTRVNGEDPYYYRATVLDINLDKTQDIIWTDMSAINISKTQVFLNDNFNTFVESSSPMNLHNGYTDGLCCPITLFTRATVLDINNDRKPDINIAQIDELAPFSITNNWQRINTTTNNSVKLKLVACNGLKEGWGARVRYKVGGVWYYQQHNAYSSSGYPFLYLGMGTATTIETIEVTWFGGAVTTLSGINAGEFKVMEENVNCNNDALSSFSFNTLTDTTTNCGASATLAGPSGFATYSWNSGAASQSISVTKNGFYKLTVTNNSGCSAYDSTYLSIVKSDILQNNTTICKGASITLSVDSSFAAQNLNNLNLLPSNLKVGLKAYYPFSGNANDVSGNNNNGTVTGATLTSDRFGNANSAYSFNGSSFIDLGNIAGVGYSASQDISMSFWINEGASGTVISKYTNLDAPNSNFFMSKATSTAQLAGNGTNSFTASNIKDYRWASYVFIAAAGTNKSFLYRNGILVATGTLNANGSLSGTKIMLGKLMGSPSNFFTGKIDDVFIYNRALTVAEIVQLSNFQPKVSWSTGATTNTISVTPTATTKYYATVTDGITSCMDSVIVTVSDIGTFNPFPTQSSTCGVSKLLDAGAGYTSYLWSTGATSQTISPTINGEYRVTVTNDAGCTASDTLSISLIKSDIIQANQTVCANTTLNLFIDSTFSGSVINAKSQMSASLQTGLVAYYPFNGNASDISGNNNVLTANGVTLTTDRFGRSNSAYSFTNTQTSVTNYLKAVNPTPFAKNTYTISAWFNSRQFYPNIGGVTYNYQSIVFYSPQWYTYGPAYHLALQHANNSILEGGNWTTTNTNQGVTTANGSIVVNQWYHVVLSYDGTNLKMYKDGQLVGSRAATISYANQIQFLIGGAGDGPNPGGIYGGFNGKIDDVGFWDRALTLNEIQELYNGRPSVLWSTSETSNKISVTPAVTTKYYATLTDGIASCTDSVTITVDNIAGFNPLQDTVKICGDSTVLDAGTGYASYNWSNGATTSTITAKSSGRYIATVFNASGCSASDTSYVSIVKAKILQRDTTICLGNSITLAIDSSTLNKSSACLKSNLPAQLQNGLIAYYPFCGNANDGSGNGTNGILFGAPTLVADRFGNSNAAYNFNGSNQYIQTASISEVITNKTISVWVKLSSLSQMGGGLAAVQSSNGSIFDAVVYNETNSGWGFGSDNLTRTKWSGVKETASEWVMLTATYENNSYKLYRNGVLISSTTQFPITSFGTTSKFNIGLRHNNGGTPYLNGVIDDVYFYNKALSSSEILSLFNATAVSWSTGASSNSITVSPTITTKYFVTVSDGINTCNDSITVTVSDIGTFNPLQDTVKVCGDSTILDAGAGYVSYNWSNGATTRTITAKSSGKYFVTVTNASGCGASDTSIVSIVKAKIFQRDTTICKGSSITLSIDSSLLNLSLYNSINLSSQANFNICSLGGFSTISSGTSLFGGIPFTILPCNGLNSWNSSIGGSANPRKLKLLLNSQKVETLELLSNTYWGQSGPSAYNNVSFWSGGVKIYNKDLIGNVDTRDFLQNSWTNNINNTTTINVKNFTTTSPVSRLDKIKIALPTPNYVDSIIITDIGDTLFHRLFVYGATVKTKKHTVLWSNGDTTTSISVAPLVATKYYVTISDGITSCIDSVTVAVSDIGSFNPLQDTVKVCGDSTLLDAGAGYAAYNWSNGATTRIINADASGKYFVTVTNASGCSARDTSVISIINANIIQSDTTVCKGNNLTLQINLKPNQNATWSTGATTPSIVVNPTVKTTYKVTVTDGITTCTDSVVVDVSSSELKVTDPAAVCSPGVVNLTAAAVTAGSAAGLTYTYWKDSTATQALANPDKVSVSGTYYIVGTSSTGCTSASTAVKVTVNPLPVASIVTPTQTTICDKSTLTLTATGGTSYQWLFNGAVIAGATSSTYAASLAGSYEVNVIALGCTSKVAAPVNLSLITAAVPKFSNSSTCIDVPVSYFNETDTTTSGSVSWLWDFGDGQTSTIFNPVYTYKKSGAFNVKLTVTPKLCSSLPVSFTKNIMVDVPPVGIKYPDVLAVKNKAMPLSARFIANGYSYLWMPSTGLNNGAIQKPVFNASQEQLYRVRLTSPGGCITMDTVKVSVYDSSDIFVPKAFSPNKDGKNDLLQPFLVNITTLKFFRIYNRWGQLMFQSTDSKQGWDGMYNYKPQPLETYTWIAEGIDGNGTTIFRKGQTVLIR